MTIAVAEMDKSALRTVLMSVKDGKRRKFKFETGDRVIGQIQGLDPLLYWSQLIMSTHEWTIIEVCEVRDNE